MRIALIIFSFIFCSCKQDKVYISYVRDGDTFVTSKNEVIRLEDADAPETQKYNSPGQPYGEEAKSLATTELLGKEVGIIRHGKDRYGRTIATIYTLNGTNFAEELVKAGLAFVSPKYCKNKILLQEFYEAKENKIGLFKDSYEIPYIYRRKIRRL